jgi:hypothetical protein
MATALRLYLEITAYAARREGLWDELMAAMDLCEGRLALQLYWATERRKALVGRMPPEWRELAEEELDRRLGGP